MATAERIEGHQCIPYQEVLMMMIRSTVDETGEKFNGDWLCLDPYRISESVASVTGDVVGTGHS
jgi:hypothetical protein